MSPSDPQGALIVIDFANYAGKREVVFEDESIASIHEIIPYLIRSISLKRGLNVLSDEYIADGGDSDPSRYQIVPKNYRRHPSAIPSKPLGSSIQRPRFTTKDSKEGKAITDDEFE